MATTSTWQRTAVHPETMRRLIEAYGSVRANLLLHAPGWPAAADLAARVSSGQPAYGMAATGPGRASQGSLAIVRAMAGGDPLLLWICVWGGANTLAQSLIDTRAELSAEALARAVASLRIYSISDPDYAGAWIRREFSGLSYILIGNGGHRARRRWPPLRLRPSHYPEAGAMGANLAGVKIENPDAPVARVTPTEVCRPQWIAAARPCSGSGVAHIILADTDQGSPALTSYRRVILTVRPFPQP